MVQEAIDRNNVNLRRGVSQLNSVVETRLENVKTKFDVVKTMNALERRQSELRQQKKIINTNFKEIHRHAF